MRVDLRLLLMLILGIALGIAGSVAAQSVGDTVVYRCVIEEIIPASPSPTPTSPAPAPTATALPPPTPSPAPQSTTYYVRPDGNDSNRGTSPSTAWRTIQRVNDHTFLPGESALLERGGVWDAALILDADDSGIEGQPVLIGAYGDGDNPVIDCATSGCDFGVFLDGAQYVTVEDLTLRAANRYGVYLQGDNGRGYTFQRLTVSESTHYGMKLYNFNDSLITDNEVFTNGNAGIGVLLAADADPSWTTKAVTVANNLVYDNAGAGVFPHGESGQDYTRHGNHWIYGNTIYANGDGVYHHRTQYNRVFGNLIYENNNTRPSGQGSVIGEGDGIAYSSDTHFNDAYDNTIYGQRGRGLHYWGGIPSQYPNAGPSSYNRAYRNVIYDNERQNIVFSSSYVHNITLAYNLVYGSAGEGMRLDTFDNLGQPYGHIVINNTIVDNNGRGIRTNGPAAMMVQNNAFSGNDQAATNGQMPNLVGGSSILSHNCYHEGMRYNATNHPDPATADPQATVGDPLFVDPVVGNYHFRAGSPCLTAGADDHSGDPFAFDLDRLPASTPPLRGAYSEAQ